MANALSGSPVHYRKNALGDYRAQGNGRSPMSAVNALQALSMIPGVGDIIGPVADAAMYYDKPETRTPGNFALSTLGLLPFVPGMTVFHGSPHKFDAFDISKIGTGEGAQAYGHGLYLAENPNVAGSYQRMGEVLHIDGKPISDFRSPLEAGEMAKKLGLSSQGALHWLAVQGGDIKKVEAGLMSALDNAKSVSDKAYYNQLLGDLARIRKSKISMGGGNLYTVDLPDEAIDRMLDWDKPLSEQPEAVRKAITAMAPSAKPYDIPLDHNPTGAEIYGMLSAPREVGQVGASNALRDLGIPGIKYLDQGSRASGNGTRNFVVFDDKLAKIIKRE